VNATELRSVTVNGNPGTNVWNCSTAQLYTNTSCWSIGRIPIANDSVVFNGAEQEAAT